MVFLLTVQNNGIECFTGRLDANPRKNLIADMILQRQSIDKILRYRWHRE